MRIVAGRFKGTALTPPSSDLIRPTSDKVREAMFNILMHGAPAVTFEDAKVLDLFAGTGALGFEALSRGAARCVFVDNSGQARAILRQNAETLGVSGIVKHLKRDATALGGPEKLGACDLAFVDPPYGRRLGEAALTCALDNGWLAADAVVVLEEARGADIAWDRRLEVLDERTYGDTQCAFAKVIGL